MTLAASHRGRSWAPCGRALIADERGSWLHPSGQNQGAGGRRAESAVLGFASRRLDRPIAALGGGSVLLEALVIQGHQGQSAGK